MIRMKVEAQRALGDLRVLFEDNHLLAVDKPAGLLTQAAEAGDGGDSASTSSGDLSGMSDSEAEPAKCGCCERSGPLRTAKDCCYTVVCSACIV
ncbi:MAG: hypothetical protein QF464_18275, partial [Myxococcota bacterium]|nr:hypothetical protein [Myxococcota bacterium]